MKNKKLIRFVESFIILPSLIMSGTPAGSMGAISQAVMGIVNTPSIVSLQKQNIEAQKIKADAIDGYFELHEMPLAGTGMKMVIEAEKNGLDWRLLPAIAVRESTGGKNDCDRVKNNPFGWGSCKIGFDSIEEAITTVAKNLGGNNPSTAYHYDNKTTIQILHAYNPPSIVPRYAEQVIFIMNMIGAGDIAPPSARVDA